MGKRPFCIVDVFAEEKYAGNQLAVVLNTNGLSDTEMQRIAKEMNYSETTFLLSGSEKDGAYDVRIFTPEKEVPFAGHPTLGTAYVIRQEILKRPVDSILLNLKVGKIPVYFNTDSGSEVLWMKQIQPTFGKTFSVDDVAQVLNLNPDDIDKRFVIQEVSTGLPFIIVPLRTLEAVKKSRIDRDWFQDLVRDSEAKAILVFSSQTYNPLNDINVRVFADCYGVPEDPATGSANGCLAGYLVKYRYFESDKINVKVEQGYEIGRRSLLYLRAQDVDGKIDINVGGKVVMIARGVLV
ncbi:MAG: PhzF family phenazine biosynthesis protein [Thermacetogeniaceae bacterium]